ncbi:16S rRNA (cytosine(1402)-N(4))-methyltransferase RsmH [bacterium]|nr:16S rRNA (cytosine(1402)-N(4))-methyltransferase RsmH [bacterium]
MNDTFYHLPVLLKDCIAALNLKAGGIYVDGTLGGGGHTEAILKKEANCRVLALDADLDAIRYASERLKPFGERVTIRQSNFRQLRQVTEELKIAAIDGLLLDLGVSSFQLDASAKGFSYRLDTPLNMQMNDYENFSAYDVINGYNEKKLADIFFHYGEEKNSRRIARKITEMRQTKPISTTGELVTIIGATIPERFAKKTLSRIFQAIRIEVNNELENLKTILTDAAAMMNSGGRIAVIAYHSLEDRIVKDFFKTEASNLIIDENYPELSKEKTAALKIITKKPIVPTDDEMTANPRARSAKLRIAEKI